MENLSLNEGAFSNLTLCRLTVECCCIRQSNEAMGHDLCRNKMRINPECAGNFQLLARKNSTMMVVDDDARR